LYHHDLPSDVKLEGDLAIDTEAMGLITARDRLCVIQISSGNGEAHLIRFEPGKYEAPNIKALLARENSCKIFHFGRFDMAIIKQYLGVTIKNVYCTKIASKLARTYTDSHGYKDLCRDLLGVSISKQQQSSDWGGADLSREQLEYAASDVLYLHKLREKLNAMLVRENRLHLVQDCFNFLPYRVELDLAGWENLDIFAH
jgi:ribonuclease D